MDGTGEKLRQKRVQLSLSQKELSEMSGLAQSMISDVENGRRDITVSNLRKALDAMRIALSDFFRDDTAADPHRDDALLVRYRALTANQQKLVRAMLDELLRISSLYPGTASVGSGLLVAGTSAAGLPIFKPSETTEFITVPKTYMDSERFFLVSIAGDSMQPRIPDGSYVVVQKDRAPENGDIALVYLDDAVDGEYTVKQFFRKNAHVELISLNESYGPMVVNYATILSAQKVVYVVPPEQLQNKT